MSGKLYVVATPIGNLSDITLRAIEVLKSVSYVLSEDTRETEKILKKFEIGIPQLSYRDQNHEKIMPKILDILDQGNDLALTSDSGTPLISDPGFKLVRALKERGYGVESVPGPSGVTAALSISGLPSDKFIFLGFLPKKPGQRTEALKKYGNMDCTLTIYESPFRVGRLLEEICENLGDRTVCVAKDLTKLYEQVETGRVSRFLENPDQFPAKGEYIVMVAKDGF